MEVKLIQSDQNQRHLHIMAGDELIKTIDKSLYKKHLTNISHMTNIQEELEILEQKVALNYALFLLSRRSYSTFELKKKLKEKLISRAAIDLTLSKCEGYISDEELILSIIRVEAGRGKGERAIVEKLVKRMGRNREEMAGLVEENYTTESRQAKAIQLLKKKFPGCLTYETKAKALRHLVGRGFSYQIASEAVSRSQHELVSES